MKNHKISLYLYTGISIILGLFIYPTPHASAGGSLSLGQAAFEYSVVQGTGIASTSKYIVLSSETEEGYDFIHGTITQSRATGDSSFYIIKNQGTVRIIAKLEAMGGVYQLSGPNEVPAPIDSPRYKTWTHIQEGATYALADRAHGFIIKLTAYKINITGSADQPPIITYPRAGTRYSINYIPRFLSIEWYAVENARNYDVEVICSTCVEGGLDNPFLFTTGITAFNKNILTDDEHLVRVRARFDNNTTGPWTAYVPVTTDARKNIYTGISVQISNTNPKATDTFVVTGQSLEGKQYDRITVYVNDRSKTCTKATRCEITAGPFLQGGKIFYSVVGSNDTTPWDYHFNEGTTLSIPRAAGAPTITRLSTMNLSTPQVDMTWTVLPEINHYQIEITSDKKGIETFSTTNTYLQIYPLTNSGVYRFRVRGVYTDGTVGSWSIDQSLTYQKQTINTTPVQPLRPVRKQPPYSISLFLLFVEILGEL